MANDTQKLIRNLVIYEIYVRNHGPNGKFSEVDADLERIKEMGVDFIWFMPIHPIGKLNKKGSLGCPYSISDYREINPEYGTREEFSELIHHAHDLGLKVMIDVVFNHTSHDSVLVEAHPDWYHQNAIGKPITTVPEWSDVIDLKHPNKEMEDYLIDTLKLWADFGVDGFRCDVASLLPEEFWIRARDEVVRQKPGIIWLAESVHAAFIEYRHSQDLTGITDSQIFRAFDIAYDYDIYSLWQAVVKGRQPVSRYIEMLRFQNAIYPKNYVKLRYVENHDQERIMNFAPSREQALAWTAFSAFNCGAFLIYGGQESAAVKTPSLFDIDKVQWKDYEFKDFLTILAHLKKDPAQKEGQLVFTQAEPAIVAVWEKQGGNLLGVFNVSKNSGSIPVPLPDGDYVNELDQNPVTIKNGLMNIPSIAAILRAKELSKNIKSLYSDLLDFSNA